MQHQQRRRHMIGEPAGFQRLVTEHRSLGEDEPDGARCRIFR